MKTRYWKADITVTIEHPSMKTAAALIRSGEVVAFPTETVYGLGADARNSDAVRKVFEAKGRPSDNPLIVHIAKKEQLQELAEYVPDTASELMNKFWPGPLTLVLPLKKGAVSPLVSAGLTTVGVRMPSHPIALRLIEAADAPIAAPSANKSGRPSPTTANHVLEDLDGKISAVIDGGECGVGLESTVVQIDQEGHAELLRPGGISIEQLREALPSDTVLRYEDKERSKDATPRSPGMKYTHYAPKGDMTVIRSEDQTKLSAYIEEQIKEAKHQGLKMGVLTFRNEDSHYTLADHVIALGNDLEEAAARLYAALREFDQHQIDVILSEACSEDGMGYALMNRLRKAAGNKIIEI